MSLVGPWVWVHQAHVRGLAGILLLIISRSSTHEPVLIRFWGANLDLGRTHILPFFSFGGAELLVSNLMRHSISDFIRFPASDGWKSL